MWTRWAKLAIIFLAVVITTVACQSLRQSRGPNLTERPEGAVRLATYNVHYIAMRADSGLWSKTMWGRRKAPLDRTIKAIGADIIAFQEMETFQGGDDDSVNLARDWLLQQNPKYKAAATGDWRVFPSTQPVLYRRDKFEVLDQGWFFFSDTPDVIYSRTFNGSYPAFASWVRFRNRADGGAFRVVNVHTDYASLGNRRKSMALVAARIRPWIDAGETVFLAGDLNARLGSGLLETLETVGLAFAPVQGATYHFDRGLNLFGAIDHLGFSGRVRLVGAPMVFRDKLGDVWPTDHYPVVADFVLGQ